MDYTKIGFDTLWEDAETSKENARKACIYGVIFAWTAFNLLVSIVRTIWTSPGHIPEEKEWDMSTDSQMSDAEANRSDRSEIVSVK